MSSPIVDYLLEPIYSFLNQQGVTEISYNGREGDPCFIEINGEWSSFSLENVCGEKDPIKLFENIFTQVASLNNQQFSKQYPLLSGTLPRGHRIQVVHESCVKGTNKAFSIRKPSEHVYPFESYLSNGAFENVTAENIGELSEEDQELLILYNEKKYYDLILSSVRYKKNIIISGGTGSGKTTFHNSLIATIDKDERLIAIEDTEEIVFPHKNSLYLLAPENNTSTSFDGMLKACLRLRPDRIMPAEIRGAEAFTYLQAINTGHPGSMTTIHANSPTSALDRLYMMVAQAGLGLSHDAVKQYVLNTVDVVIQLNKRRVSGVWFRHADNDIESR